MRFEETVLKGAWLVAPEPVHDDRGFFARSFCVQEFGARKLETKFVQHSISFSRKRHTLRGIHFHFTTRNRAVGILGADRGAGDGDGPDAALAPEQRPECVHRHEEVAAVLLHHREQQVAAGVPGELRVAREHRQAREEHAARFGFVRRERKRALEDIAGRQHPQLVPQLARTSAAVEHRDDGVDLEPGIALEAAKQARESRAAAETPDIEISQSHPTLDSTRDTRAAARRRMTA